MKLTLPRKVTLHHTLELTNYLLTTRPVYDALGARRIYSFVLWEILYLDTCLSHLVM